MEKHLEARAMFFDGKSQKDIANHFGVSTPTVGIWLQKAGLTNVGPTRGLRDLNKPFNEEYAKQCIKYLVKHGYTVIKA